MTQQRRYELVVSQLAGVRKSTVGDSTFILCPFHSEKTPSGRVFHSPMSKTPGYFKCYGCGHTASWNELAEVLNLKKFGWSKPTERTSFDITPKVEEVVNSDLQLSPLPSGKVWRGFKTDILTTFGCKLARRWGTNFVFMPVIVSSELRGYILGRIRKVEGETSYINAPGGWSKDYGLFPYHIIQERSCKTVVLVEGPRDALRLLQEGIPALAILGTQSWSKVKTRSLELLGVERVILCFDGDSAGLVATAKVKDYCKSMFAVDVFDLAGKDSPYHNYRKYNKPSKAAAKDGVQFWDAYSMPKRKLEELKRMVDNKESRSKWEI